MKRWLRKLDDYWFAAMPAGRLAVLRILIGAFALYYVGARYEMFVKIAGTDAALFDPVGAAAFLSGPIDARLFEAILIATLAANVAFVLGWRHRYTGPLFGALLLWLLCYRNSWSMIFHSDNALVFHVLILGLSRAADAYSLDALSRRKRLVADGVEVAPSGWRYGWPIRLICAATVATYFLAGVAKIATQGLAWASGEALRAQVAVDGLRKELLGDGAAPLSYALYDEVWLFALLGAGTLVFELGAPLALLDRRIGYFWAINVWLMHWGIFFVMGISFRYQLAGLIFLSFFPLERLIEQWRAPARKKLSARNTLDLPDPDVASGRDVVVYDGQCRICAGQMLTLARLDLTGRLAFLSLHDGRARERYPDLSFADLMEQLYVVDRRGARHGGALAARFLSRRLPLLWPLSPLLHLPGALPLWRRLYRQIARRRYLLGGIECEEGTCQRARA